jgi:hypothetical protein
MCSVRVHAVRGLYESLYECHDSYVLEPMLPAVLQNIESTLIRICNVIEWNRIADSNASAPAINSDKYENVVSSGSRK